MHGRMHRVVNIRSVERDQKDFAICAKVNEFIGHCCSFTKIAYLTSRCFGGLCRALQHRSADAFYQSNRLISAVQRRFGGQANIAIVRLTLTPKTRPPFKKMAGWTPDLSRRQSDQLQNRS
jgi:hypothetical protein